MFFYSCFPTRFYCNQNSGLDDNFKSTKNTAQLTISEYGPHVIKGEQQ